MNIDHFKDLVETRSNKLVQAEFAQISNPDAGYGYYFSTWYNGKEYNLGGVFCDDNKEVDWAYLVTWNFSIKAKYDKKKKKLEMISQIKDDNMLDFRKDFDSIVDCYVEMQKNIYIMGNL